MFRRAKQWSVGVAGVLTLVVGMSGAYAQAPSAEDMASFETFLRTGTEAQKNGAYREAIEQFGKAAEIVDHPRLQMEIGQAYEKLGECRQARSRYQALGNRVGLDEQYVESVKERLVELESCIEYGELAVECTVSGTEIELKSMTGGAGATSAGDGVSGACPGTWKLAEGEYTLTARAPGVEDEQKKVRIVAGKTTQEYVRFQDTMFVPTPKKSGGFSDWGVYAGAGAAGVGAILTTIAVVSDSNSGERLQELQRVEQSGNTKLFKELSSENDSIRSRNIGLYAGGAALLLGGTGVLVWSLLSPSADANKNSEMAAGDFKSRVSFQVAVQPTEVGFKVRW